MARYLFLFIATLFFIQTAYPQLDKKMWLVGGAGSFKEYNQTYTVPAPGQGWSDYHYAEIDAAGKIGYFVLDKFAIGLSPAFSYYHGTNKDGTEQKIETTKLWFGPFVRYYLLNKHKPFNIASEVVYQPGIQWSQRIDPINGTLSNLTLSVGPEIFFNQTISLEMLLGYRVTKGNIDGTGASAYSEKRTGLHLSVGIQIHLQKR